MHLLHCSSSHYDFSTIRLPGFQIPDNNDYRLYEYIRGGSEAARHILSLEAPNVILGVRALSKAFQ
jgi:hypothetical protein